MATETNTSNGTVNRLPAAKPEGTFKRLSKLFDKLGDKKTTTVRRKTEAGTVTLTVKGKVCLDRDDFVDQAAKEGGKGGTKPEAGFGEAEAATQATFTEDNAVVIAKALTGLSD